MAKVRIHVAPYTLPFRQPWTSAAGTYTTRRGFLVRLRGPDGVVGYGEAAPLPGYGGEPLTEVVPALRALAAHVDRFGPLPDTLASIGALSDRLSEAAPDAPAARAGLELALADRAARRAGLALARWLRSDARSAVEVNAVVGAVPAREARAQALTALKDGFRTVKIKLGTDDEDDLVRVTAVRATVGPAVALRADANGAWTEAQARFMLRALAGFGLAYVEQPVPAAEIETLARLRADSPVPVAADESLLAPDGPARVLDRGAADVLVLKPSLLGGPIVAWQLAARASAAGLHVVVTSSLESAVGRAGALHLAAALPAPHYAAGLATGRVLAEDVAVGPDARAGAIALPDGPGLGLAPEPQEAWQPVGP